MNEKNEYSLTFFEVCEKLGRSRKTISRYIRQGILNPIKIESKFRTPEYRFSEKEIIEFRTGQAGTTDSIGQEEKSIETPLEKGTLDKIEREKQDRIGQEYDTKNKKENIKEVIENNQYINRTGQDRLGQERSGQDGSNTLLTETIHVLRDQLHVKDKQIEARDRHIEKLTDKIGSLIERNREANFLLKSFQDRLPELEAPKQKRGRKVKHEVIESVEVTPREEERAEEKKSEAEVIVLEEEVKDKSEPPITSEAESPAPEVKAEPEPEKLAEPEPVDEPKKKSSIFKRIFGRG